MPIIVYCWIRTEKGWKTFGPYYY